VNRCPRPLDPIDAEALASGVEPAFSPDAAEHAASCPACGAAVEQAKALTRTLEGLADSDSPLADLADRVSHLRAFSARERRTYALWQHPVLLTVALAVGGLAFLVGPSLSAGEQAGLSAAALAPVLAFLRSIPRWGSDLARIAPSALEALADAFARERALGIASLLLLVPSAFGLTRVFARARSRRS
jgi:hypothetical protein